MSEYRVLGRSPVMRVSPDCGCPPFEPGVTQLTCQASRGLADYTLVKGAQGDPGNIVCTVSGSIDTTADTSLVLVIFLNSDVNSPVCHDATTPSGYTLLDTTIPSAYGIQIAYDGGRTPGTQSASMDFTSGFEGTFYDFVMLAIPTETVAPVQSAHDSHSGGGDYDVRFPATATVGNLLVAALTTGGANVVDPPGWTVLLSDWIQSAAEGIGTGAEVRIYLRCVQPGDTDVFSFNAGDPNLASSVVLSEWAITGTMTDPDSAPEPGQPVFDEVITPATDGLVALFATTHAYQEGSLRVYCDGINVTNDVTERAPDSGTFSLAWAPATGDVLMAEYRGF